MNRHRRSIALAATLFLAACSGAPATDGPAATATPAAATPRATPTAVVTAGPSSSPELGSAPIGPTEVATVLSVTDGDTIRVDRGFGSEPVRYIGINTPEVGDPGGSEATAENARLLVDMEVVLEKDVSETDQFDRLLRYVWIGTGSGWTFINVELVRRGFAQAATYPPDVRFADYFITAERGARSAGVGLWAPSPEATPAPTPVPTPVPIAPPPTAAPVVTAAPVANCHPSYSPCLPIVADLDCPDVRALGAAPVSVIGPDDYRLDGDHDGIGCE